MKRTLVFAGVVTLMATAGFAQTPVPRPAASAQAPAPSAGDPVLATAPGSQVNVSLNHYNYTEPGDTGISIHNLKFGGEYTGTIAVNRRQRWFAQVNLRGTFGNVTYDGWCSPWQITPSANSPNGYLLDVGNPSPCSESGDRDWYVESRGLVGKDFIGQSWGVSPFSGVGFRHLSNGTTGTPGFRTDNYLYVPIGLTLRTTTSAHRVLGFTLEYDRLLRGWQKTRNSELGTGVVAATTTAPAFSIDSFTDTSFAQHSGWALRASATYQAGKRWSIEPYYIRWRVAPSPPNNMTIGFTVNKISAHEQLGFYEPLNFTREFGVKLGLRFGK